MVILLDNGHGRNTAGKCSPDGKVKEWLVARQIVAKVSERLKSLGFDVVIITPECTDVPLMTRINRVNYYSKKYGKENCLLISVHVNAAGNGGWRDARGCSVFVSRNASATSRRFAQKYTSAVLHHELNGNRAIPVDNYWESNFAMVHATACPAILTENLFMDNKEDCEILHSEEGLNKIAQCHVDAICEMI